jgi:hypothetical protein
MSAILPLPSELTSFVGRAPPQALLIRGPPGTGKTTLALTLLQAFPGDRVYVSGRVRRPDLLQDYPWLSDTEETPVTLVDYSYPTENVAALVKAIAEVPRLLNDPDAHLRLRSLLLPPEVLEAWSSSSPERPSMVVLDSWDSIVERHLGITGPDGGAYPDRRELERIALAQMSSGPVMLVLVVEDSVAPQLEYLANGVVTLSRSSADDRLERWLHLDKLRGVRIASPAYPFSLEGGRFQCAERLDSHGRLELGARDPEPDRYDGAIWPGSADYASFFGRPHVGRLTLIVKDHQVPDYAARLLITPLLTSILSKQGRMFHVLSPRFHPDDVWNMCRPLLTPEQFVAQVRLEGIVAPNDDDLVSKVVLHPRPGDFGPSDPRTPEAIRFFRENLDPTQPNLAVIWTSGLRALNAEHPGMFTPENLPGLVRSYFRETNLHELFIGFVDDALIDSLAPMAETQIRMVSRNGRVFVYGVDPPTPFLVLSGGDDHQAYRLLQVV